MSSRYLLITLCEDLAAEGTTHDTAVICHRLVPGTEAVEDMGELTEATVRAICRPPTPDDERFERMLRKKPRRERPRDSPRHNAQVRQVQVPADSNH